MFKITLAILLTITLFQSVKNYSNNQKHIHSHSHFSLEHTHSHSHIKTEITLFNKITLYLKKSLEKNSPSIQNEKIPNISIIDYIFKPPIKI